MSKKHSMPFGTMLRAARLRWCYVPSRDCFVRVHDLPNNRWHVELAPNDTHALGNGSNKTYRVMSDEESETSFKLSPYLSGIKSVKKPFKVVLDDYGRLTN